MGRVNLIENFDQGNVYNIKFSKKDLVDSAHKEPVFVLNDIRARIENIKEVREEILKLLEKPIKFGPSM